MRIIAVLFFSFLFTECSWSTCIPAGQEQAEIKRITAAREAAGVTTEPFLTHNYPPISFQDAALPTVWLGPDFFELVGEPKADGKSYFQGICSGFEEKTCVQWCFARADSPQIYSAKDYLKIANLCQKCGQSKEKSCDDVQFLNNTSDSILLNTYEKKTVVLQKAVSGHLLVFQTDANSKKDISKPYLKLTYLNSTKAVYQKVEVVAGPDGAVQAESSFTKDSRYGYNGFRVCDQAILSTKSCQTQIQSTKSTTLAFSCKPKGATNSATGNEVPRRQ